MKNEEKLVSRTGYIHLAFSVGSKEKVEALSLSRGETTRTKEWSAQRNGRERP